MNTSTLKTFAPAMRRQLIKVVRGKLDYVITAQTPDYLDTFKTQVAALKKRSDEDREGLIEHVAHTWFNRLAALRYLDAREWHPFRARVLMPAAPGEMQPEILKLMRSGVLPEELKPHTDVKRLDDLLDGRIPIAKESIDAQGEVYRHLVLAACRYYHGLLPELFEKLDDETELLLPDDLLTSQSVAQGFRDSITDDDCQEVEVLGWLYQFYISEKKDAVMARKKAVPTEDIPAVTQLFTPDWIVRYLVENSLGRLWLQYHPDSRLRERMEYFVNSEQWQVDSGQWAVGSDKEVGYGSKELQGFGGVAEGDGSGRGDLWSEQNLSQGGNLRADQSDTASGGLGAVEHRGRTGASIDGGVQKLPLDRAGITGGIGDTTVAGNPLPLSDHSPGRASTGPTRGNLQNANQPPHQTTHPPLTTDHRQLTTNLPPEEIRLLDPAVGSGHMLTYAFDLLYAIYEEEGYAPSEIPGLILQHNLYGLDICPRAVQLAQMALVFKAREKARRFFQQAVQPHIRLIHDVHFEEDELQHYTKAVGRDLFSAPLLDTLRQFEHGSTFGSLIRPKIDDAAGALRLLEDKPVKQDLFLHETHQKVLSVLRQAEFLGRKYHVVVANPPYMGGKGMNGVLKEFLASNYKDVKSDLFAAFIVRNTELAIEGGQLGFMCPFVWMFISSYQKLREFLIDHKTITSLIQLEYSGFEGATVPICTFTLENKYNPDYKGSYIRLSDFKGAANQGPKALEIIQAYRDYCEKQCNHQKHQARPA